MKKRFEVLRRTRRSLDEVAGMLLDPDIAALVPLDAPGDALPPAALELLRSDHNATGYAGVCHTNRAGEKPFKAAMQHCGRTIHLGTYETAEEAARVYTSLLRRARCERCDNRCKSCDALRRERDALRRGRDTARRERDARAASATLRAASATLRASSATRCSCASRSSSASSGRRGRRRLDADAGGRGGRRDQAHQSARRSTRRRVSR